VKLPDSPINGWLDELRTEEARLVAELARVRAVLAAARGIAPGGTAEMARAAMQSRPDEEWSADSVRAAIEAVGWVTTSADPTNAVRAALTRGVEAGWLLRVGRGGYRLAGAGPAS
jgi:hypothetical protein